MKFILAILDVDYVSDYSTVIIDEIIKFWLLYQNARGKKLFVKMIPTNKYDAYWFPPTVYICKALTLITAELIKLWLRYRKACANKVFQKVIFFFFFIEFQKLIWTTNFMYMLQFNNSSVTFYFVRFKFPLQLMLSIQVHCHLSWIRVSL